MPYRLCPLCLKQGTLLEQTSRDAVVEYYRCNPCNHAWTHRKDDPMSPPVDITVKLPLKTPENTD